MRSIAGPRDSGLVYGWQAGGMWLQTVHQNPSTWSRTYPTVWTSMQIAGEQTGGRERIQDSPQWQQEPNNIRLKLRRNKSLTQNTLTQNNKQVANNTSYRAQFLYHLNHNHTQQVDTTIWMVCTPHTNPTIPYEVYSLTQGWWNSIWMAGWGDVAANESPKPQYLIQDLLSCLSQHAILLASRLGVGRGFRKASKAARIF